MSNHTNKGKTPKPNPEPEGGRREMSLAEAMAANAADEAYLDRDIKGREDDDGPELPELPPPAPEALAEAVTRQGEEIAQRRAEAADPEALREVLNDALQGGVGMARIAPADFYAEAEQAIAEMVGRRQPPAFVRPVLGLPVVYRSATRTFNGQSECAAMVTGRPDGETGVTVIVFPPLQSPFHDDRVPHESEADATASRYWRHLDQPKIED